MNFFYNDSLKLWHFVKNSHRHGDHVGFFENVLVKSDAKTFDQSFIPLPTFVFF